MLAGSQPQPAATIRPSAETATEFMLSGNLISRILLAEAASHIPLMELEIAAGREQPPAVGCKSERSPDAPTHAVAQVNVRQHEALQLAAARPIPEAHAAVRGGRRQVAAVGRACDSVGAVL